LVRSPWETACHIVPVCFSCSVCFSTLSNPDEERFLDGLVVLVVRVLRIRSDRPMLVSEVVELLCVLLPFTSERSWGVFSFGVEGLCFGLASPFLPLLDRFFRDIIEVLESQGASVVGSALK